MNTYTKQTLAEALADTEFLANELEGRGFVREAERMRRNLATLARAVEDAEWIAEPTEPGYHWHWDGEIFRVECVFIRPGHDYLAIQDQPIGSGKRSFRMVSRIGGYWKLIRPPAPPAIDTARRLGSGA